MKKYGLCILGLIFALWAFPQEKANSARPLHPRPGRVLKLVEVLRIPIEGEGYFYEGARDMEIDKDGNLYINDSWSSDRKSHLLKFSPEGRFLKDVDRQGERPGEIQSSYDFSLNGPDVVLYDSMKRKIVVEDLNGNYRIQFSRETSPFDTLYGSYGEWLIFGRKLNPMERKTSRLYDIKHAIVFLSKDGKTERELCAVNNQMFYVSLSQGGGGMNWDPFEAVVGGARMFINSTQEYRVQILDLKTGKIEGAWTRDYPRVAHALREGEKKFVSQFNAPKRRYQNDILGLLVGGGFLWVQTSMESKDKGILYDLFDSEGRFADSFFIDIKGRVLKIADGFLYASNYESDSDPKAIPALVKYRIGEPVGAK